MRYASAIALFILSFCAHAQTGLVAVRDAFYAVSEEKAGTKVLWNRIEAARGESQNLLMAYTGMYHMLAARDYMNPVSKWNSFKKGKNLLDKAIENDNNNPEIRLLRLSAQLNTPSFLGYNNNIEADKRVILNSLGQVSDKDLRQRIMRFIAEQGLNGENS